MESPFPGMDPFLEQHWRSVHHRLITYLGDQLQAVLPSSFRVEVEERVFVAGGVDGERSIAPDVFITKGGRAESTQPKSTLATNEPIVILLDDEPTTEAYLEIVDTASGEYVVTAIELLSPTNKIAGDGNALYVRKQSEYRAARVNQVEIDLTRCGDRGLVFPMIQIPSPYRTLYLACVRRGDQPLRIEVYPMPLQNALPILSIPLGARFKDVPLDLQAAIDVCYRNGRYEDIDYRAILRPALPESEATWTHALLEAKGLLS